MRKKFRFFLFLLAACTTLVACSDDEDDVVSEPEADYTVMLYGCGGGNLDDASL